MKGTHARPWLAAPKLDSEDEQAAKKAKMVAEVGSDSYGYRVRFVRI